MFENIAISSLSIIGIAIVALSLVRYKITRNKAEGLILLSIGLGIFALSLIARYIIMDDASNMFLIIGVPDIIFAVLFGLRGIYELGTGGPRTFLLANQKMYIIGPVVLKFYRHGYYYCFEAVENRDEFYEVPIMYAILRENFSKSPKENSIFETDKKGKII